MTEQQDNKMKWRMYDIPGETGKWTRIDLDWAPSKENMAASVSEEDDED